MNIAFLSKTELNIRYLAEGLVPHPVIACRSRDELLRALPGVDVLVVQNQGFGHKTVDAECLRAAGRLRLIQHHGVAHDATDAAEAARRGIPVATVPGQNSRSVAEHAFFLLLALARRATESQALVAAGRMGEVECTELGGKTLCVVGIGTIGTMLARMGRGFAMRVIGVRRNPAAGDAGRVGADEIVGADRLHEALAVADAVVLSLPLNADTVDLVSVKALAAMKAGALLINVSRGPHVNRAALEAALRGGRLGGFATDAWWDEPADPRDPLLQDARVIVTPHTGGKSIEAIRRTVRAVRENIDRLERGEPLRGVVAV
jgi:phosphoglycerate dehydrogenase-like enzyme